MSKLNLQNVKEKLQDALREARKRQELNDDYSFDVGYERGILRALELLGMLKNGE
jgi:hypothetical protein